MKSIISFVCFDSNSICLIPDRLLNTVHIPLKELQCGYCCRNIFHIEYKVHRKQQRPHFHEWRYVTLWQNALPIQVDSITMCLQHWWSYRQKQISVWYIAKRLKFNKSITVWTVVKCSLLVVLICWNGYVLLFSNELFLRLINHWFFLPFDCM